jgi:hypothetical protein
MVLEDLGWFNITGTTLPISELASFWPKTDKRPNRTISVSTSSVYGLPGAAAQHVYMLLLEEYHLKYGHISISAGEGPQDCPLFISFSEMARRTGRDDSNSHRTALNLGIQQLLDVTIRIETDGSVPHIEDSARGFHILDSVKITAGRSGVIRFSKHIELLLQTQQASEIPGAFARFSDLRKDVGPLRLARRIERLAHTKGEARISVRRLIETMPMLTFAGTPQDEKTAARRIQIWGQHLVDKDYLSVFEIKRSGSENARMCRFETKKASPAASKSIDTDEQEIRDAFESMRSVTGEKTGPGWMRNLAIFGVERTLITFDEMLTEPNWRRLDAAQRKEMGARLTSDQQQEYAKRVEGIFKKWKAEKAEQETLKSTDRVAPTASETTVRTLVAYSARADLEAEFRRVVAEVGDEAVFLADKLIHDFDYDADAFVKHDWKASL